MARLSFSVLLLLSVGVFQTFAASPRIQLEIGTDASGCVNVGGCSYGCGKISPATGEKNILTPLCPTGEVELEFPQHLTIRGKSESPHILDEDSSNKYKCSAVEIGSSRFVCRHKNKRSVKSANPSASASSGVFKNKVPYSVLNDNVYRSAAPEFSSSAFAVPSSVAQTSNAAVPSNFVAKTSSDISLAADKIDFSSTLEASAFDLSSVAFDPSAVSAAKISISKSKSAKAPTATPDSDVCQYISEIFGTSRGLGNLDDCCLRNDDCHGSCINGSCDAEHNIPTETWDSTVSLPTPTACKKIAAVYNKGQGIGNLGDCCINSNDCRGACISGSCNAEKNAPAPVCNNNAFKGRRKGNGPAGVCCNTQADCKESCDRGVCTAAEDNDEDFYIQ